MNKDASLIDMLQAEQVQPQEDRGGAWVKIGTKAYKVPPLNFRALKKHMPALAELGKLRGEAPPSVEQMATIAEIVHAALVRNYTSMTLDEVEDMLDIANMIEVLNAVMAQGGLVAAGAPGEAKAAP